MRSRYSAFALGLGDYLRDTWHPGTCPEDVSIDSGTEWLSLEIVDAPTPGAKRGIVEFIARYRENGTVHELHERSRFVVQSGRWWYLDGVHN